MNKSRWQWKSRIAGIALILAPVLVCAAGVYTGIAPVASQSDQDRAVALRAALTQAVTQAAKGDAAALRRPDVARALTRAERYVQRYSYQPNDAPAVPGKASAKFLLVAQFDAAQIDALLRDQAPAAPPSANAAANLAAGTNGAAPAPGSPASDVPAAPPESPAGTYRLWFDGLRSAEDYARLIGALDAFPEVLALRVERARGEGVQVRIDARGSLRSLTDSLDAARIAHPANAKAPVEGVDAVLDIGY